MREEPFAPLLAAHGLALDLEALTPFARWCPNFRETRRFDTLFFLAEAPADAPEPRVSEHEAVRAFWASAADILAEVEAGDAHVIFPTRRNLERLAALRLDRRGARRCRASSGDVHHALGRGAGRRAPCLHPRGHRLSGHLRAAGDGAAALRPACASAGSSSRRPARCAGGGRPDGPRLCPPPSRGRALDRARPAPADRQLHRPQAQCARRGSRALPGLARPQAGARFTALPARNDGPQCGYDDAVRLSAGGGALPGDVGTACPVAAALARLGVASRPAGGAAPFRPRRSPPSTISEAIAAAASTAARKAAGASMPAPTRSTSPASASPAGGITRRRRLARSGRQRPLPARGPRRRLRLVRDRALARLQRGPPRPFPSRPGERGAGLAGVPLPERR